MGWQTGRARLTSEEARAQLLAIGQERSSTSLISRYPLRSLAIALAAGFLFARTIRFWSFVGSGGSWLLKRALPLSMFKPPDTALTRLQAHARRIG